MLSVLQGCVQEGVIHVLTSVLRGCYSCVDECFPLLQVFTADHGLQSKGKICLSSEY